MLGVSLTRDRVDEYSGARLGYVFLLFLLYGVAILPLMYLASFLFLNTSVAYSRLTMFNVATGMTALITGLDVNDTAHHFTLLLVWVADGQAWPHC